METKMQGRPTDLELDVEDTDFAKAFEELMKPERKEPPIKYIYKNWKGEIGVRTIYPLDISYGSNEYHHTPTYLLRAWDLDKKAIRTFDMTELVPYKEEVKLEYILCSAIHFDNKVQKDVFQHSPVNITSGFVLCGRRHHNVFAQLPALKFQISDMKNYTTTQGFLTNEDRFLDRGEALIVAYKAKQTDKCIGELFSEDLW